MPDYYFNVCALVSNSRAQLKEKIIKCQNIIISFLIKVLKPVIGFLAVYLIYLLRECVNREVCPIILV